MPFSLGKKIFVLVLLPCCVCFTVSFLYKCNTWLLYFSFYCDQYYSLLWQSLHYRSGLFTHRIRAIWFCKNHNINPHRIPNFCVDINALQNTSPLLKSTLFCFFIQDLRHLHKTHNSCRGYKIFPFFLFIFFIFICLYMLVRYHSLICHFCSLKLCRRLRYDR